MTANPPAWSVRCPWCGAPPGVRCTSPRGRRLTVDSHDARIQAHRTAENGATPWTLAKTTPTKP